MRFVFHGLVSAAKAVFFALPGIVAFLIAAASLAVFYMEELQAKLKDQRLIRWVAAIALLLIGIGAFAADKIQKVQERDERERAVKETSKEVAAETAKQVTRAVTGQYSQMVADQKNQITDLQNKVAAQAKDVSAIKGSNIVTGKKPVKVEVINPSSPSSGETLPNLSWTQEQTGQSGGRATLMIDFRIDDFLKLPAFVAICDKPCTTISATAPGDGATQAILLTTDQLNVAGAVYKSPRPLPPGTLFRIRLVSADVTPIRVLTFRILKESEIPLNLR